ncbi:MAG: hypothetical protein QM500_08680 [Methylococcales bacterium]
MMNVPFKLRQQEEFCTPKGPSFDSAKVIAFSINGSRVEFKAPKHKTSYSSREQLKPKSPFTSENMIFRNYPDDSVKNNSWKLFSILSRSWGFWGPWFTGAVAETSISVSLVQSINSNKSSFFHPRAFENAIGNFLSQQYSHEFNSSHDKQYWLAPINWKPIKNGVKFKVLPNPETFNSSFISEYAIFSISEDMLLVFTFWVEQHTTGTIADKDKLVDRKPLENLIKNIIDSIKIKLSPEAQAQKEKALAGLDDVSLSKVFAPLKWYNTEQATSTKRKSFSRT